VSLLFLAPFCVLGGKVVWGSLSEMVGASVTKKIDFRVILSVFLAVFFLFSSGFVYEVCNDRPSSFSLSSGVAVPRFNEQEVVAAEWLVARANSDIPIYADLYTKPLIDGIRENSYYIKGRYNESSSLPFSLDISGVTYFFLGYQNAWDGEVVLDSPVGGIVADIKNLTLYDALTDCNNIYDSGGANSYFHMVG
jgi:uncharacterized membrane protein